MGGAAGDALGYTIEFSSINEIKNKYGENGIEKYDLINEKAIVSDDTQMTMFTANALLNAKYQNIDYINSIRESYKSWLFTQNNIYDNNRKKDFWIMNEPNLFKRRAPGCTCISSISCGANGTIEKPVNNSKGCGGVMRVAPIGLFFDDNGAENAGLLAAQSCALTHGHELGYIPCYFIAYLINLLSHSDTINIKDAVMQALSATSKKFVICKSINYFIKLINKAIDLSESNEKDLNAIKILGEGWVAEETAAIAVYCSLKYSNDFDKAIRTSVNHSGDSDSTGAVTGNILGSYIGIDNISKSYIDNLEFKDMLYDLSWDLCANKIEECREKYD